MKLPCKKDSVQTPCKRSAQPCRPRSHPVRIQCESRANPVRRSAWPGAQPPSPVSECERQAQGADQAQARVSRLTAEVTVCVRVVVSEVIGKLTGLRLALALFALDPHGVCPGFAQGLHGIFFTRDSRSFALKQLGSLSFVSSGKGLSVLYISAHSCRQAQPLSRLSPNLGLRRFLHGTSGKSVPTFLGS